MLRVLRSGVSAIGSVALTSTILFASASGAESFREIDLSTTKLGEETVVSVPAGDLTIRVVNAVIANGTSYSVEWEIGSQVEPPLSWPTTVNKAKGACPGLSRDTGELRRATEEGQVAALVDSVGAAKPACSDAAAVDAAEDAIARTMRGPFAVNLPLGAEVVFTIVRRDGGATKKTWIVKYKVPRIGDWVTSYGFAFLPNDDELFVTTPRDNDEGGFEIRPKADNRDFDFVPTVFYSYMPTKWRNRFWSHSLGAGLGFDLSDPVVLVGYSATFRHNVSLLVGGAMQQQRRLAGQYSLGSPVVDEALTEDQLTDRTYDANWFFGVSLRFGKLPETHQTPEPVSSTTGDGSN